jgi:hypothetical protein
MIFNVQAAHAFSLMIAFEFDESDRFALASDNAWAPMVFLDYRLQVRFN